MVWLDIAIDNAEPMGISQDLAAQHTGPRVLAAKADPSAAARGPRPCPWCPSTAPSGVCSSGFAVIAAGQQNLSAAAAAAAQHWTATPLEFQHTGLGCWFFSCATAPVSREAEEAQAFKHSDRSCLRFHACKGSSSIIERVMAWVLKQGSLGRLRFRSQSPAHRTCTLASLPATQAHRTRGLVSPGGLPGSSWR